METLDTVKSTTSNKIERFHMNHILPGSLITFSGPSSLQLVFEFLNFNLDFPIGLVVTNDPASWTGKIPDVFLFPVNKLDKELIENLEKRQKRVSKRVVDHPKEDARSFLVLDFRQLYPASAANHIPKATLDRLRDLVERRQTLYLTVLLLLPQTSDVATQAQTQTHSHASKDLVDYFMHWHPDYLLFGSESSEITSTLSETHHSTIAEIVNLGQVAVMNLGRQCQRCRDRIYWYHPDTDRLHHFRICHPKYWSRGTCAPRSVQKSRSDFVPP